jgi:hypothetical protein
VLPRRADDVGDESAVVERGGAGSRVETPDALELLARRARLCVARREQRLGLALMRVTSREKRRRGVEMLVRKRDYFEPGHGT